MYRYVKYLSAFSVGVFILPSIYWPEIVQAIVTCLGLFGIVLAYGKFISEKKHESTLSVVDQLNFFRTEILRLADSLTETLISNKLQNNLAASKIDRGGVVNFELSYIETNYPEQLRNQGVITSRTDISPDITRLLNSMEEFSWSVILNNTIEHEALYATHDAFIFQVEQYTRMLLTHRNAHPKQYEGIKQIYSIWINLNKDQNKN